MAKIKCSIKFENEVICQICGYKHQTTIQNHIRFKHPEIKPKEYMEKYDAEITSEVLKKRRAEKSAVKKGPMSEEQKQLRSKRNKEFWSEADDKRKEVAERMRQAAKEGNHPSQTEEFRQQARENAIKRNKTKKQKQAVKAFLTGRELPREQVEKSAAGHRGKPLSKEHKAKLSAIHREAFANGSREPVHAKIQGYYTKLNGDKIPYMSNLEVLYFKELDSKNIEWKYEPCVIQYELNGIMRNYFPDVLNKSDNELVEVKSKYYWYLHKEMCEAKAKAARKYCEENNLTYKILYEDDLDVEYHIPEYIKNYNFPRQ